MTSLEKELIPTKHFPTDEDLKEVSVIFQDLVEQTDKNISKLLSCRYEIRENRTSLKYTKKISKCLRSSSNKFNTPVNTPTNTPVNTPKEKSFLDNYENLSEKIDIKIVK